MAASLHCSKLSQLHYSPLNKSTAHNYSFQFVPASRKPSPCRTLSSAAVSIPISSKLSTPPQSKRSPRSTPGRAASAKNFFSFHVENMIISSKNVSQQTSSGPAIISKRDGVSVVLEEPGIGNGSGGHGSNAGLPPSGGEGNCGGGSGEDDKDFDEETFGPIMKFEDVVSEAERRGATLPSDMLEAAKTEGIRSENLNRYLDLQTSPLGCQMRSCSMFRNRMLADPSFSFKVLIEIASDTGSATSAELQKKYKDFWSEFKLYAADILVGAIVDVAVVGMLAPYARLGPMASVSRGSIGQLQLVFASLPSSVFEAGNQGFKFSLPQRITAFFYKGFLFGTVGFGRGLICHGNRNTKKSEEDAPVFLRKCVALLYSTMTGNRNTKKSKENAPLSPLKRAAVTGAFFAVSANTRYQIINGLEQLVQSSPLAKQFPAVAPAFTVGVRLANNIYDRLHFEDWTKWSGVIFDKKKKKKKRKWSGMIFD